LFKKYRKVGAGETAIYREKPIKTAISVCLSSAARNNTRLRAGLTWFCAHQAQILLGMKRKLVSKMNALTKRYQGG
jgi:hypothetical protein